MTIFNQKQYELTKEAIQKFRTAIEELKKENPDLTKILQAQLDGMNSVVEEMTEELADWDKNHEG
jgi:hypothetical protein